ncbi:MAG: mechanosensitive ion channel family protein [Burkholderiaceae bacterium]
MDPINLLQAQATGIARDAIELVPQVVAAGVVLGMTFLVSWGVQSVLRRLFGRSRLRPSLRELLLNLAAIAVWIGGCLVAATIVFPNLTPAKALAGLGLGSVAIGFAFKDIFENFLAGLIILFRREMRLGDFIECEGLQGRVEKIAVRESHIRQTDGQLVIVPNALLFKNPLTILTDLPSRRTTVICGIRYGDDMNLARQVMTDAIAQCESVQHEQHPIQVFAQAFGESSIDFELTWWTGSKPLDVRRSRDEVMTRVKAALDANGIEIPFPIRTVEWSQPPTQEQSA